MRIKDDGVIDCSVKRCGFVHEGASVYNICKEIDKIVRIAREQNKDFGKLMEDIDFIYKRSAYNLVRSVEIFK